jgi:hypothetical protein
MLDFCYIVLPHSSMLFVYSDSAYPSSSSFILISFSTDSSPLFEMIFAFPTKELVGISGKSHISSNPKGSLEKI